MKTSTSWIVCAHENRFIFKFLFRTRLTLNVICSQESTNGLFALQKIDLFSKLS